MNRLDELRRVRSEIERLRDAERRLSVPIVINEGMIGNLYDVFSMTLKWLHPDGNPKDTENRKKFLYAIIYLFSPATLVGGVMRHRLREIVSRITGCTPTGVSRDYKTAMFFYATYNEFRKDVDIIIRDMLLILGRTDEV